jgi:hypothetical protein
MDFQQILEQRTAKAAAAVAQAAAAYAGQVGRPPSPTSKRSMGWRSTTVYLRPETRLELQQAAGIIQLADPAGDWPRDQSEIVEQAVAEWLTQHRSKLQELRAGNTSVAARP